MKAFLGLLPFLLFLPRLALLASAENTDPKLLAREHYGKRISTICDAKSGALWTSQEENYCIALGASYIEAFPPKMTPSYEAGLVLRICLTDDKNVLNGIDRFDCLHKAANTSDYVSIRQLTKECEVLDDVASCFSGGLAKIRYNR